MRHGKQTAAYLASEFNVSVRTIMNDLYQLSLYYPIEITRGRGGGVSLSKGFIINGYIMRNSQLDLITKGLKLLMKKENDKEIQILLEMIEIKDKHKI